MTKDEPILDLIAYLTDQLTLRQFRIILNSLENFRHIVGDHNQSNEDDLAEDEVCEVIDLLRGSLNNYVNGAIP